MKKNIFILSIILLTSTKCSYSQTIAAKALRVDTVKKLSITPIRIKNSIRLDSLIYDGSGSSGTLGQGLTRSAAGTAWQNIVSLADSSKWELSGSDIYNKNSGNVGIGDITPSDKLDVNGSINYNEVLKLDGDTFIFSDDNISNNNLTIGRGIQKWGSTNTENLIIGTFYDGEANWHDMLGNTIIGNSAAVKHYNLQGNSIYGWAAFAGGNIAGVTNCQANAVFGEDAFGDVLSNSTGNSCFGQGVGTNRAGNYNSLFGYISCSADSSTTIRTMNNQCAFGYAAGYNNATGNNCFFGYRSGYNNRGGGNVMIGASVGISALPNKASNYLAIDNADVDTNNLLLYGRFDQNRLVVNGSLNIRNTTATNAALWLNNTKILYIPISNSICLGINAGSSTMTGSSNTAIGFESLKSVTNGNNNTSVGAYSGSKITTGVSNTNVGVNAGDGTTTSSKNTNVGRQAGYNSGGDGVFIGFEAGHFMGGQDNAVVGSDAGKQATISTSAWNNTIIGCEAGQACDDSSNVMLGYQAGKSYTGKRSIFIGTEAGENLTSTDNVLYIHNNNADSLNALLYGRFDNKWLRVNGTEYIKNGLDVGMKDVYTVNIKDTKGGLYAVNVDSSNYCIKTIAGYTALQCLGGNSSAGLVSISKNDSGVVLGITNSEAGDTCAIGVDVDIDNGESWLNHKGRVTNTPSSTISLSAGTQINVEYKNIKVVGNGGAVTLTSNPTIRTRDIEEGTEIVVWGTSDVNTIKLQDEASLANTKLKLTGDVDCTLGAYDNISLTYIGGYWCETARSNN